MRLNIISQLIPNAAPIGNKATAPSAVTLGRSTTSTPAKASRVASHVARVVRSPRTIGASNAVMTGLVNWIAVASASGITITPMKKQIVATDTAAPRPS